MRREYRVRPPPNTPLTVSIGVLVNVLLLGTLLQSADTALALVPGLGVAGVVLLQAERQGWGVLTRSLAGVTAGVMTFLALSH